jgi:hypothetical protein
LRNQRRFRDGFVLWLSRFARYLLAEVKWDFEAKLLVR